MYAGDVEFDPWPLLDLPASKAGGAGEVPVAAPGDDPGDDPGDAAAEPADVAVAAAVAVADTEAGSDRDRLPATSPKAVRLLLASVSRVVFFLQPTRAPLVTRLGTGSND